MENLMKENTAKNKSHEKDKHSKVLNKPLTTGATKSANAETYMPIDEKTSNKGQGPAGENL